MSNLSHAPLASLADAEGVIEFKSIAEIEVRQNFRPHLDPTKSKLVKIVGWYSWKERVQCGLPDHTPHGTGYVVATEDGYETNIGHVCGTKHFGEVFQVLRNKFESRRRVKSYREQLATFKSKLPTYHVQVLEILADDQGANWLNTISTAFRRGCPEPLWEDLRTRARLGDGRVSEVTLLRGDAAERRLAAEGKLRDDDTGTQGGHKKEATYTVETLVGTIAGLGIWSGVSIRELLIDNVQRRLSEFEVTDVFSLSLSETALRKLTQYADSVDGLLKDARTKVAEGRAFFTDENMALFQYLKIAPQALAEFRKKRWDNKKGDWRSPMR